MEKKFMYKWIVLMVICISSGVSLAGLYGEANEVGIENKLIKFVFNTKTGTYKAIDKRDGKVCLSEAYFLAKFDSKHEDETKAADISSKDEGVQFQSSKKSGKNEMGAYKRLIIKALKQGQPVLVFEATIYDGKGFVILDCSVDNVTDKNIRLMQMHILIGRAYEGFEFANYKTLDGISNENYNAVSSGADCSSKNNILATFGESGKKRSLVIGGLKYKEFDKSARVVKKDNYLEVYLWEDDPYGKRIDARSKYESQESFYVDFTIDNRFEILEEYGRNLAAANKVCFDGVMNYPVLNMWYVYTGDFGGDEFRNNSAGVVGVMDDVVKSGFTKYSKLGIRLEQDDYSSPDNQQGWWDDEHWGKYKNGQLISPYETTKKWADALKERGGEPFVYCQTGRRSDDYCKANPGHMLFNESFAERDKPVEWWKGKYWTYDWTDPGFQAHLKDVYKNLRDAGIKGLKFDYPRTGWAYAGGFEDKYSTTAGAYRKIYETATEGLGKGVDIHERMGPGDLTLGAITTMRTEGDSDSVQAPMISKIGLRWYKSRVVVYYDKDAYNPFRIMPDNIDGLRTMYTVGSLIYGRMELGKYFDKMTEQQLYVLSRVVPFHTTKLSARPIDAFDGKENPAVYDFAISDNWHQLMLYNTQIKDGQPWSRNWEHLKMMSQKYDMVESTIEVKLGEATDEGGLGLCRDDEYYVYDFWNNEFVGKVKGGCTLKQTLRPGETRMLSIHKVHDWPEFISTNRHVMQGYVDMKVCKWDGKKLQLSGKSDVVAGEPYKVIIACNGFVAKLSTAKSANAEINMIDKENGLAELVVRSEYNGETDWIVEFDAK